MVNNVATVGRNGVHDFILIRTSAIILALYSFFILGFFLTTDVTYEAWTGLFSSLFVKVFTLLAIFALLVHAWIGVWQVLSDYVKPALLRGALQFFFAVLLLSYLATGFITVWGV